MSEIQSSRQKALEINLDEKFYGNFAEIGAGQEVARHFFKAGAASGTIAKTICAYDMTYSDFIYGKEESGRYVCESRLVKMLKREYDQLAERLVGQSQTKCFFAYANTVAIRNFHGTNEAHGWMGIRFQHEPMSPFSEIILHLRLFDLTAQHQQDMVGVSGVNLIYASFYNRDNASILVSSILNQLDPTRVEVDMLKVSGPAFKHMDSRLVALELVKQRSTSAILFDPNGNVVPISDYLYKKNILVVRGSYRPPTLVNLDCLNSSQQSFSECEKIKKDAIITLAEISLTAMNSSGDFSNEDFLARVDLVSALGFPTLVTNYAQYFKLSSFFTRFKPKAVGIVLGVYNFIQIFDESYNDAEGGLLESLGVLFRNNTRVLIYPAMNDDETTIMTSKNIDLSKHLVHLYKHFSDNNLIIDIENYDAKLLNIYSRKVLNMITNNEVGWEQMVPQSVAKTINDKCLFGHPCESGIKG
jgi:hypothetical protein